MSQHGLMLRALTAMADRMGMAQALGMQFGGARDMYKIFGWKKVLRFEDYWAKYKRQDVAKRIIDAPAAATWRNPPRLQDTVAQAFRSKWDALVQEHSIWSQIERVDRLAGVGQYAVLLLGLSDSSNLAQPVRGDNNELLYIQPYAQPACRIDSLDNNAMSPRFGLPEYYTIEMVSSYSGADDIANTKAATKSSTAAPGEKVRIHWSRIVHVAENCLDSNFLGTPRLESVYNLLDDLLKVAGGTSETYWLTGNRGIQIDIDKDAQLTEADAQDLSDEIDEYQSQLRRVLRTRGVKVNTLGSDIPDPKNTFDMIISLISGATGIPKRVLTGSEAGQLASDQDRANWADRIKERRTTFAEPSVLIPLLSQLMAAGVLPKTKLTKLDYVWPPNFQLTPLEEAQSMAQKARAAINLAKQYNKGNMPLMSIEEARILLDLPASPTQGTIPKMIVDTPSSPSTGNPKDTSNPLNDPTNDPNAVDNAGPT